LSDVAIHACGEVITNVVCQRRVIPAERINLKKITLVSGTSFAIRNMHTYPLVRQNPNFRKFTSTFSGLPLTDPLPNTSAQSDGARETLRLCAVCFIQLILLDEFQRAEPEWMAGGGGDHECVWDGVLVVVVSHVTEVNDRDGWGVMVREDWDAFVDGAEGN
jgi:hypothetical protein